VLDAGHGGHDSGAVSPEGPLEKHVVLDITKRVRTRLSDLGYTVFVTRHDDRFLSLEERPRRAEAWEADVFVSIHANSGGETAKGTETFALSLPGHRSTNQRPGTPVSEESNPGNRFDAENMALAFSLHRSLLTGAHGLTDRGVRRARFAVLKLAPCPAALVEVGFLTHAEEGKALATAGHRAEIADSLAAGIDNYLREVQKAAVQAAIQSED